MKHKDYFREKLLCFSIKLRQTVIQISSFWVKNDDPLRLNLTNIIIYIIHLIYFTSLVFHYNKRWLIYLPTEYREGSVIKVWYFIFISKINAFSWYQLIIVIFHYNAIYLSTSLKIKQAKHKHGNCSTY